MKTYFIIVFLYLMKVGNAQDSIKPRWFNIGFQGAFIVNKGLSNLYNSELENTPFYYASTFTKSSLIDKKPICFGFSVGAEGILGKSKHFKHLITLHVDYTNSYYNHYYQKEELYHAGSSYYIENLNVKRSVTFLVGGYGVKFQIRSFNISTLACFNFFLLKKEIQNGYIKQNYNLPILDSIVVKDKKITSGFKDTNFVSLRLRVGYDIRIKNQLMTLYLMRNINVLNIFMPEHSYYAPWWYVGIQIIPDLKNKQKHKHYHYYPKVNKLK